MATFRQCSHELLGIDPNVAEPDRPDRSQEDHFTGLFIGTK